MLGKKSLTHSGCEHVPDDVHAGRARSDSRVAFRLTWGCQSSKNRLILFRPSRPDSLFTANQLLPAGMSMLIILWWDLFSVTFISRVLLVKLQPWVESKRIERYSAAVKSLKTVTESSAWFGWWLPCIEGSWHPGWCLSRVRANVHCSEEVHWIGSTVYLFHPDKDVSLLQRTFFTHVKENVRKETFRVFFRPFVSPNITFWPLCNQIYLK